jgi:anti-anti-sigma factor
MSDPPGNPMIIVVFAAPGCRALCVRITGDVDLTGQADLARTAQQLAATMPRMVYLDLTGVTFAGAVLINFLFTVSTRLPAGVSMSICGPPPMTRRIIDLTGLDQFARIRDCHPADWATPPVLPAERTLASAAVAA